MQKIKHFFYKYSVYFFYLFVFIFIFLFIKYYINEDTSYFKVNTNEISLFIGDNYDLSANVRSSFDTTISWKSEDENIVRIINNKLVAVGSGFTKITSTYNENFYEIDVNISEKNESISSIILNSTNINLTVGKTFNLVPSFIYEDNSSKTITYESSNSKVATINKNGVINGLKPGKAIITVSKDDMKATATVNVYEEDTNVNLSSIKITNASENATIYKGEYLNLETTIYPINATNQNITWSSSNPNVATVSNGIVKAVNAGNTTIIANSNGKKTSVEITIKDTNINVESISLDKKTLSLNVGEISSINATISPSNANNKNIIWSSSDNNIATVSDGKIKAISAGNAIITAISNNKKATVNVTINNVNASKISLDKTSLSLNIGEITMINATISPSNTTNKNITWSSSNPNIATVSDGKIKAINAGSAIITATCDNIKSTINITVSKVVSKNIDASHITFDKPSLSLNIGETSSINATISPSNTTNKNITWSSSNPNVATVNNGVVNAINEGTANIIAKTDNGIIKSLKVTVINKNTYDYVCKQIEIEQLPNLNYEKFISVSNNKKDNFEAIKKAHECANKLNIPVEVKAKATYHIYNTSKDSAIIISTNTNFNNATFYIHDEENIVNKENKSLFIIKDSNNRSYNLNNNQIDKIKSKIKKSTTQISELAGYGDAYIEITNKNKYQFIRYGNNEKGKAQYDSFIIDNLGNLKNDIIWNFNDVTSIKITPIPSDKLTIQSGNFITIADTKDYSQISTSYVKRNISVQRSNTNLNNINHKVVDSSNNEIDKITYMYSGFINISNAAKVNYSNSSLYALQSSSSAYASRSTYDLNYSSSVNVTFTNIVLPKKQLYNTNYDYWGVTGSNYTKDVTYDNCKLNRVDAHSGVHNLTIKNSLIGNKGITVIGSGTLLIKNTEVKDVTSFITLRHDYGSTWNGTIKILDSKFSVKKSSTELNLIDIFLSYDGNKLHDFGYDIVLPNVIINGLTTNSYRKTLNIYNNPQVNLSTLNNYTDGKFKYILPTKFNIKNVTNLSNENITVNEYKYTF